MADYISAGAFNPSIPKHLITQEDQEIFDAFGIITYPEGEDKVFLFADDWCTTGYIQNGDGGERELSEDDLYECLKGIIRRSNGELPWISRETAYTCSKNRGDGFGGSAIFITADDVQWFGTSSWLEQRITEAETGDTGPHSEEPEPMNQRTPSGAVAVLEDMLAQYGHLHDMLSDCIEGGRLSAAELPDDYAAIVDQLCKCVSIEHIAAAFINNYRGEKAIPTPKLAVVMKGGLIQSIVSDLPEQVLPLEVMVIDYDTDGADDDDISLVPQGDGTEDVRAYARLEQVTKAGIDLASVLEQITGGNEEGTLTTLPEGTERPEHCLVCDVPIPASCPHVEI